MMPATSTDSNYVHSSGKIVIPFIWIRVIACLAIVILHTLFASNVYFEESITSGQLAVTQTIEQLLMWAVPCFLMVTGALLLQPERTIPTKKLFGCYIRRIALALITFTLLFQILDFLAGDQDTIIRGWISNLFQGHSWAHMWYLYLMLGLYLMIPFYRMITAQASLRQIWGLIALITVFTSLMPLCSYAGIQCGFYIPTQLIYPVYIFAGYALFRKNLPARVAVLLLSVSTAAIILLSLLVPQADIFGYDSILIVIQSLGIFSVLLRLRVPARAILRSIDECSFGIYLFHMIGIRFTMKWMEFNPYTHGGILSFVLLIVLFFITSYAITYLVRQIPKANLL